jgi:hypothetical protein
MIQPVRRITRHFGGNCNIKIKSDCVALCETGKVITLRIREWTDLHDIFSQIYELYPELAAILACDHFNFDSFLMCGECSPAVYNEVYVLFNLCMHALRPYSSDYIEGYSGAENSIGLH